MSLADEKMLTSVPLSDDKFPDLASRGDLVAYLAHVTELAGADFYMLVGVTQDRGRSDARIIASNWMYDAIQLFGHRQLAAIAEGAATISPGNPMSPIRIDQAPAPDSGLDGEAARLLHVLGHVDLFSLRLHVGRQRYFLMLSSAAADSIDTRQLAGLHVPICYALSSAPDLLAAAVLVDPLTDRERECMHWVSQGKTTDEIAVILSVTANTANSYITNAIQKLGSDNRAMAMATAIRSGVI